MKNPNGNLNEQVYAYDEIDKIDGKVLKKTDSLENGGNIECMQDLVE